MVDSVNSRSCHLLTISSFTLSESIVHQASSMLADVRILVSLEIPVAQPNRILGFCKNHLVYGVNLVYASLLKSSLGFQY